MKSQLDLNIWQRIILILGAIFLVFAVTEQPDIGIYIIVAILFIVFALKSKKKKID